MSAAILSAESKNHYTSSLMMKSSTSISGASSVSSLESYQYASAEDFNNHLLVMRDPVISSISAASPSRDCRASPPQQALPFDPLIQQLAQYKPKLSKPLAASKVVPRSSAPQQAPPIQPLCSKPRPASKYVPRSSQPQLIATISVGFEKGDYLVREEKGFNVYFDFLEEAYNFIIQKGYSRMPTHEEDDYMELIKRAHKSVPGGCRFNPGRLLMVMKKKLVPVNEYYEEPRGQIMNESMNFNSFGKKKRISMPEKLSNSSTTLPTDDETSNTSNADSWE